jgi:hypothetical protein
LFRFLFLFGGENEERREELELMEHRAAAAGDPSSSVVVEVPMARRRTKEEAFHILAKMVMQQTNEDYVRSFLLTYKKFATSPVDVVKTWRRQYPFLPLPLPPPSPSSWWSSSLSPPPQNHPR